MGASLNFVSRLPIDHRPSTVVHWQQSKGPPLNETRPVGEIIAAILPQEGPTNGPTNGQPNHTQGASLSSQWNTYNSVSMVALQWPDQVHAAHSQTLANELEGL